MVWDPSKHPRKPAGSPAGGEFSLSASITKASALAVNLERKTAAQINASISRVAKLSSQHNDLLIAMGRGNERPSDRASLLRSGKIDSMAIMERNIEHVRGLYLSEIERRMGAGFRRVEPKIRGR